MLSRMSLKSAYIFLKIEIQILPEFLARIDSADREREKGGNITYMKMMKYNSLQLS